MAEELPPTLPEPVSRWKAVAQNTAYIVGALLVFLFSLDLMISSLQHLGNAAVETIILATSNPFTGLFIGLLITAIIQSSSATTAMTVALVASGNIALEGAVPIIMGANVGTSITSTLVSLGFIQKKKEFRRAVAAGTYHDFFNILTVILLFPLEYYYKFLSGLAQWIASSFFDQPLAHRGGGFQMIGFGFGGLVEGLVKFVNNGFVLAILAIGLLYGSILFFRRAISNQLGIGTQERFKKFFFRNTIKSFGWGLLITAFIRSSTVTTSLVVPLVAKKVVRLKDAVPFILGANIGTTITAFIAAMFNSNAAISIAVAHFLFNFIGVVVFFGLPVVREVPVRLARKLGDLTLRYRLTVFLYVLVTFFFIPFGLIYLNKNTVHVRELTYARQKATGEKDFYKVIVKTYQNQQLSSWMVYDEPITTEAQPSQIVSVYKRKNLLVINNELFELNKPGFCRDGEDERGKYQMCIQGVTARLQLSPDLAVDSVYVFDKKWYASADSTSRLIYVSAQDNVLVKKEKRDRRGNVIAWEELIRVVDK
ncbi:MAG: Na/Pi symporter [Cyclobacteriaceae bacterium]|jgi:sodium-dependent phosphate cotransporter|nr:Na/Pi symporter [Cyclobacteriaceae bacterium]